MRTRAGIGAQIHVVVRTASTGGELPMCAEGPVLDHAGTAAIFLQCTDATAAQVGIAVSGILRVISLPHPRFALRRTGRSAQVRPLIAVGKLARAEVWVHHDDVCP